MAHTCPGRRVPLLIAWLFSALMVLLMPGLAQATTTCDEDPTLLFHAGQTKFAGDNGARVREYTVFWICPPTSETRRRWTPIQAIIDIVGPEYKRLTREELTIDLIESMRLARYTDSTRSSYPVDNATNTRARCEAGGGDGRQKADLDDLPTSCTKRVLEPIPGQPIVIRFDGTVTAEEWRDVHNASSPDDFVRRGLVLWGKHVKQTAAASAYVAGLGSGPPVADAADQPRQTPADKARTCFNDAACQAAFLVLVPPPPPVVIPYCDTGTTFESTAACPNATVLQARQDALTACEDARNNASGNLAACQSDLSDANTELAHLEDEQATAAGMIANLTRAVGEESLAHAATLASLPAMLADDGICAMQVAETRQRVVAEFAPILRRSERGNLTLLALFGLVVAGSGTAFFNGWRSGARVPGFIGYFTWRRWQQRMPDEAVESAAASDDAAGVNPTASADTDGAADEAAADAPPADDAPANQPPAPPPPPQQVVHLYNVMDETAWTKLKDLALSLLNARVTMAATPNRALPATALTLSRLAEQVRQARETLQRQQAEASLIVLLDNAFKTARDAGQAVGQEPRLEDRATLEATALALYASACPPLVAMKDLLQLARELYTRADSPLHHGLLAPQLIVLRALERLMPQPMRDAALKGCSTDLYNAVMAAASRDRSAMKNHLNMAIGVLERGIAALAPASENIEAMLVPAATIEIEVEPDQPASAAAPPPSAPPAPTTDLEPAPAPEATQSKRQPQGEAPPPPPPAPPDVAGEPGAEAVPASTRFADSLQAQQILSSTGSALQPEPAPSTQRSSSDPPPAEALTSQTELRRLFMPAVAALNRQARIANRPAAWRTMSPKLIKLANALERAANGCRFDQPNRAMVSNLIRDLHRLAADIVDDQAATIDAAQIKGNISDMATLLRSLYKSDSPSTEDEHSGVRQCQGGVAAPDATGNGGKS